jgi:uncharacterized Zn-binding protein involved in type VI secretion
MSTVGEKAIIRMGDRTSHGGTVIEGHQFFIIHGKAAAGVGHRVTCPKCSGSHVIVEGAVNATMMGIRIAVEGMRTSCGAILIASQITDTIEVGGGSEPAASPVQAAGAGQLGTAVVNGLAATNAVSAKDSVFNDYYVLVDVETGAILAHTEYAIVRASGEIEHGVSDAEGKTHLLSSTTEAEEVDIYV